MNSIIFSRVLDFKLQLAYNNLTSALSIILSDSASQEKYVRYLLILHGMIRGSVPVMSRAVEKLSCLESTETNKIIIEYLKTHIEEEKGHEDWLAEDLSHIYGASKLLEEYVPSLGIAMMVGMQYYWIEHHDPKFILGYIAAMEGRPPSVETLDKIFKHLNLKKCAFSTLYNHANIDQGHRDSLSLVLDKVSLSSQQRTAIVNNALQTVKLASEEFSNLA